MDTTTTTKTMLTTKDVRKILRISRTTMYAYVRGGLIRGIKVGRLWRFDPDDIDRMRKGGVF